MSKSFVVVAAVVVAAIAWFASGLGGEAAPEPVLADSDRAPSTPRLDPPLASASRPAAAPAADDRSAVATSPAAARRLRGRVVDAETKEPLSGARVRLFEPREAHALDLVREDPGLYSISDDGKLASHPSGDWPRIEASSPSRFGRERVRVHGRPLPGQEPLAEAITTSEGRFDLPFDGASAVLEAAFDGHATRWRAVDAGEAAHVVELWRERELRGVVRSRQRALPGVELAFSAVRASSVARNADGHPAIESVGTWRARTGPDGRFAARVGADQVSVRVTARGFSTRLPIGYAVDGSEIVIEVEPVPSLRFLDAASGAPIERIKLRATTQRDRYIRWSGEHDAPDGWFSFPMQWFYFGSDDSVECTAWADGFEPSTWTIPLGGAAGTYEVPLRRGTSATLTGVVRERGAPIAGREIALLGRSLLQWGPSDDRLVDAARTADDGTFELSAPPGPYVLRILRADGPFVGVTTFEDNPAYLETLIPGKEPWFEPIDLPSAPLAIDLDLGATVRASVVDEAEQPLKGFLVALSDGDGRSFVIVTEEDGLATFPSLPAGRYSVAAPRTEGIQSFAPTDAIEVDLAPAELREVRIVRPVSSSPRHARAVSSVETSFEGWSASSASGETVELGPDGRIGIDLAGAVMTLTVRAPDGRWWHSDVPDDAPDGFEIRLESGAGAYRGELLDLDGRGLAAVRVRATAVNSKDDEFGRTTASTTTDANGRFEIRGLAASSHWLAFQSDGGPPRSRALQGAWFRVTEAPVPEGTWISIRATSGTKPSVLRGSLRDASGASLTAARIQVRLDDPQTSGTLRRWSSVFTGADGSFELAFAPTADMTLLVYRERLSGSAALERPLSASELGSPLQLVID